MSIFVFQLHWWYALTSVFVLLHTPSSYSVPFSMITTSKTNHNITPHNITPYRPFSQVGLPVPLLSIHAADDPIIHVDTLPCRTGIVEALDNLVPLTAAFFYLKLSQNAQNTQNTLHFSLCKCFVIVYILIRRHLLLKVPWWPNDCSDGLLEASWYIQNFWFIISIF